MADYPVCEEALIQAQLEREMATVLQVVELGRSIRNQHTLKVKQPLAKLVVFENTKEEMDWDSYKEIIMDELNVKEVAIEHSEAEYMSYQLKLNFKQAGPKFGKQINLVNHWLQNLSNEEVKVFLKDENVACQLSSEEVVIVTLEDVFVEKIPKTGFAGATNGVYTVMMDTNVTAELLEEGMAREFIRAVQEYRKQLNLPVNLRVDIEIECDEELQGVMMKYKELLQENLLMKQLFIMESMQQAEQMQVGNKQVLIHLRANEI